MSKWPTASHIVMLFRIYASTSLIVALAGLLIVGGYESPILTFGLSAILAIIVVLHGARVGQIKIGNFVLRQDMNFKETFGESSERKKQSDPEPHVLISHRSWHSRAN